MSTRTDKWKNYRLDPPAERSLTTLHALFALAWLLAAALIHTTLATSSNLASTDGRHFAHLLQRVDELFLVPAMAGVLVTSSLLSVMTEGHFTASRQTKIAWLLTLSLVVLNTAFLGPWIIRLSVLTGAQRLDVLSGQAYLSYRGMLVGLNAVQLLALLLQLVVMIVPHVAALQNYAMRTAYSMLFGPRRGP
jgi:hypothetical protein